MADNAATKHECDLIVLPEGEAVCLDCGAYYIFKQTLDADGKREIEEEARGLGIIV